MKDIKTRILEALQRCSIIMHEDDESVELDSFSYINAIIEIENEFDIEIPDYYLAENLFVSFDNICEVVRTLVCPK